MTNKTSKKYIIISLRKNKILQPKLCLLQKDLSENGEFKVGAYLQKFTVLVGGRQGSCIFVMKSCVRWQK